MRNVLRAFLCLMSGLIICSCDEDPASPTETQTIARVSGNAQEGGAGTTLSAPLVVLVTDRFALPRVCGDQSTRGPSSSLTLSAPRRSIRV